MTELPYDPYSLPHTEAEIFAIFEKRNFRDELGFKLTLDTKFIKLVEGFCKNASTDSSITQPDKGNTD